MLFVVVTSHNIPVTILLCLCMSAKAYTYMHKISLFLSKQPEISQKYCFTFFVFAEKECTDAVVKHINKLSI